jgi:hypothetical protein
MTFLQLVHAVELPDAGYSAATSVGTLYEARPVRGWGLG